MDNKPKKRVKKGRKGEKGKKGGNSRSGRQVLDAALEKAEAKERQQDQASLPVVRFVRGGWNRITKRRTELGEHPKLVTSKATSTEDKDEGECPSVVIEPRPKRCEIPLDYERVNRMQLEGYLTKTAVYDMSRLYLAYLSKHQDTIYDGHTYLSVGVKLRSMGFPSDLGKLRDVYVTYCKSQGASEEEVELDLQTFENYIGNRKLSQNHLSNKNRREADRFAYEQRPTGCDPECTIL